MATISRIGLFRGEDFQKFCSVLLSADDPAFQAVRGEGGDGGNDGFIASGDVLCQAYGPAAPKASTLRQKIDESLAKAVKLRTQVFQALKVFRFLTPFDLTHENHVYLRAAAAKHAFTSESWGESRLLAVLARHPEVKREFPGILLPDLLEEIRSLHAPSWEEEIGLWTNELEDRYRLTVLQQDSEPPFATHFSYDYFAVHVLSPGLRMASIEPLDEDSFRDSIRERFWEDVRAEIDRHACRSERGVVENRGDALKFHRVWGRWTDGTLAMLGTLRCVPPSRSGSYSLADLAIDATRFLRLCSALGSTGPARVSLGYDPHFLSMMETPCDERIRNAESVRLAGCLEVARRALKERSAFRSRVLQTRLQDLAAEAHVVVGRLLVPLVKDFHLARIDTEKFSQSIPPLLATVRDLQMR